MSTKSEWKLIKILMDHLNDDIKYHQNLIKKHEKAIEMKRQKIMELQAIEENDRSIEYMSEGRADSRLDYEIRSISLNSSLDFDEGIEENHVLSFLHMNLRRGLLKALKNNSFQKPFKLQQKLIMPLIEGFDAVVESNWQRGRTVGTIIATLERIDTKLNECQAIFVTNRKEFALHIENQIMQFGSFINIKCNSCVGAQNITEDIYSILMGTHIIVGTPSRVYDMINRKVLGIGSIKILIFDEINELLETYFQYVLQIIEFFDLKIQIIFLSTSMSEAVMELSQKIMKEPLIICDSKHLSLNNIKQYFIKLETDDYKFDTLIDLFQIFTKTPVVVFCNTRKRVNHLREIMESKSLAVSYLHIEMNPREMYTIAEEVNSGSSLVLTTTDYFARILNLNNIRLIVNYDLPAKRTNYAKRIGNCSDIERDVVVINFVLDSEMQLLSDIENYYNKKIEKMPLNIDEFV